MPAPLHRLLTHAQRVHLRHLIEAVERETGVEVAVLVVPHVDDIERFAATYFDHVGVGKRGHDNGLLIVVVPERRLVRIEIGRGLRGVVTPEAARQIIDHVVVPQFRHGRYAEGLLGAVQALAALVRRSGPRASGEGGGT